MAHVRQGQGKGQAEPSTATASHGSSDAVYIQNATFALKEKLALSSHLRGTSAEQSLNYLSQEQPAPPALAAAAYGIERLAAQRLRELMLLSDWPCVFARRTQLQLDRLYEQGDSERASEVVGGRTCVQLLPKLPSQLRLHVFGPLDLLLALANMLPKDSSLSDVQLSQPTNTSTGNSQSTEATPPVTGSSTTPQDPGTHSATSVLSRPRSMSQLPRSMAVLGSLPALSSLGVAGSCLEWLRGFFADLRPQQRHVGVDDRLLPWFKDVKTQAAESLVAEGSAAQCRAFARFGVPQGCRARVWECALGLEPAGEEEYAQFEAVCQLVLEQPLLVDMCVQDDMALVSDSQHFFLFEETLRSVMLTFVRDPQAARCRSAHGPRVRLGPAGQPLALHTLSSSNGGKLAGPQSSSTMDAYLGSMQAGTATGSTGADGHGAHVAGTAVAAVYPPCDAPPMQGLVLLAAPLCYLYAQPHAVYRLFKAMYCRYWCKLQSLGHVALPSPTLPVLLRVFEQALEELDPALVLFLLRLGCLPASLALPWLCCGFVGVVSVEEVLLLWDRVVGMDSLLPLPLLAVAVLCFRRQVLLACQSLAEVHTAMSDISQLQTIPLLQAVLFQG